MERSPTSKPRTRRWKRALVVLVLAGVALLLAGCIQIVSVTIPSDIESPPEMTITATVKVTIDPAEIRPTLAFRYPEQWTIVSVRSTGVLVGDFTESATIENYFDTTWEATAADKSHNGGKPDYAWWAGYGGAKDFAEDDEVVMTIRIRPNGWSGAGLLDFVAGYADTVNPSDPAQNSNGTLWEIGGVYDHDDPTAEPPGAWLDQECDLTPVIAPTVTSTTPADDAAGVSTGTEVRVVFSENMDVATITGANIFVRPVGGAALPATVLYSAGTHSAIVDLTSPLLLDEDYELVVKTAVADPAGYHLAAEYVASFSTAAAPVAPQVTSRIPAPDSTERPVDVDVRAVFDQAMDPTTITGSSFYLRAEGSATNVPATVSYVGAEQAAVLDPTGDLADDTTYTATLTAAVEGENGLALSGAPVTWSFTTAAAGVSFLDVPAGHRYYDAIMGMAEAEIIEGYPVPGGKEFRPNNPVWRAQFAKMIDGAMEIAVTESMTSPFTDLGPDLPGNLYPHEYVAAAYANAITTGITATTFGPYNDISRAQVVTMVVRALQSLYPTALTSPPSSYTNTWGTSFSAIHGPNARIAEYNGLLAVLPLTTDASDPWGKMSRGEVAQVLWNAMGLID